MRKVGGKQQHLVRLQLVHDAPNVRRAGRAVKRLGGEAHVLAHDLLGRAIDPRHLDAHAAPELGEAPQVRRQPGDAQFDQHDLEPGELGEHAFATRLPSWVWKPSDWAA